MPAIEKTLKAESGRQKTAGRRFRLAAAASIAAFLIAVLAFPFGVGRAPDERAEGGAALPERLVRNFHFVHTYLYRGGAPSEAGLRELKEMGVSTIIDLRRRGLGVAGEEAYARQLGFKYINLPTSHFLSAGDLKTVLTEIERAKDGATGPVFVHCASGSDRTSYVVAVWRLTHDRWSLAETVAEMWRAGFLYHVLLPRKS